MITKTNTRAWGKGGKLLCVLECVNVSRSQVPLVFLSDEICGTLCTVNKAEAHLWLIRRIHHPRDKYTRLNGYEPNHWNDSLISAKGHLPLTSANKINESY